VLLLEPTAPPDAAVVAWALVAESDRNISAIVSLVLAVMVPTT
jgi:hypothetical protein